MTSSNFLASRSSLQIWSYYISVGRKLNVDSKKGSSNTVKIKSIEVIRPQMSDSVIRASEKALCRGYLCYYDHYYTLFDPKLYVDSKIDYLHRKD